MSDYLYPPLNEENLRLIVRLHVANEDYFTVPECPYSQDVKDIFTKQAHHYDYDREDAIQKLPETDEMLQRIGTLFTELKSYGVEAKKSADKNTYFKLSAQLTDQLITMRERLSNLKNHEQFQEAVLDVMDEILDADQRTKVMDRLKKFVGE